MADEESAVAQLMRDLGEGRVSIEQAVLRLPGLLVPVQLYDIPRMGEMGWKEHWATFPDGEPRIHTANSWNDVEGAHLASRITTDQYRALRKVAVPTAIRVPFDLAEWH